MKSSDAINYRGLWSAVIVQAFVDLKPRSFRIAEPVIKPTGDYAKDLEKLRRAIENRKYTEKEWINTKDRAMRWIFAEDTTPCSFLWICDNLDLDAEYLRSLAKSEEGIKKVLTGKSL